MSAYLQMGHDTQNLVGSDGLELFTGIILSPLNRNSLSLKKDIPNFRSKGEFSIVFDPQLYYPHTEKTTIQTHPYFPSDFDSADFTNHSWWQSIHSSIHDYIDELGVDIVASPTIDPRTYNDDYYAFSVRNTNDFSNKRNKNLESVWGTFLVNTNDLTDNNQLLRLASFVSQYETEGIYLLFKMDLVPRREIGDNTLITGILKFIKELCLIEKEIIVSFSSSDMLLFKAAGATHCATSKFFNLRRFTPSRYEEKNGRGGQLPYLFVESLLSFLRETDIIRLTDKDYKHLLNQGFSNNTWLEPILGKIYSPDDIAWLAESWRQYLAWFSSMENHLDEVDTVSFVSQILKEAESNWVEINDHNILMDEPRNDGSWLRAWRQALSEL
jgi:hypothetical protein